MGMHYFKKRHIRCAEVLGSERPRGLQKGDELPGPVRRLGVIAAPEKFPAHEDLRTVRTPVMDNSASWTSAPSTTSSSSMTLASVPRSRRRPFTRTQKGHQDLEYTTTGDWAFFSAICAAREGAPPPPPAATAEPR